MKMGFFKFIAVSGFVFAGVLAGCDSGSPSSATNEPSSSSVADVKTIYVTDTIYQVKTGRDTIQEWNSESCNIKEDGSFTCGGKCSNGGTFAVRVCIDPDTEQLIECSEPVYVRDTVYVELNYGDHPLTGYIPYAKVPEFDGDSVKKHFAEFSRAGCAVSQKFSSNYSLEAIGLPEKYIWYEVSDFSDRYYSGTRGDDGNCLFSALLKDVVTVSNPIVCEPSLPESLMRKTYKLVDTSAGFLTADTTIQWKLVYKDQYGRGDTLDMTTHLTIPE